MTVGELIEELKKFPSYYPIELSFTDIYGQHYDFDEAYVKLETGANFPIIQISPLQELGE